MKRRKSRRSLPYFLTGVICALALLIPAGWFLIREKGLAEKRSPLSSASDSARTSSGTPEPIPSAVDSSVASSKDAQPARDVHRLPWEAIYTGDLILVNNQVEYHFPQEDALVQVLAAKTDAYRVKNSEVNLHQRSMAPLNAMLGDFSKQAPNNQLLIISGFRSREYQQMLLDARTEAEGAEEAAKWVASSGGSEHHTGLAIDFGIYDSAAGVSYDYTGQEPYGWINENCFQYGFIVRYDEAKSDLTGILYEPWHFRFVGDPHAAVMREKAFCLEEYIEYLHGFPFEGEHLIVEGAAGKAYEIYYVPASSAGETEITVPKGAKYTVSGDNIGGFIVTIER